MVLVPQRGAAPARSPAVSYYICIPVPPPLENLKEIPADIGSFITEMKPALLQLVMACGGAPASTDAIFASFIQYVLAPDGEGVLRWRDYKFQKLNYPLWFMRRLDVHCQREMQSKPLGAALAGSSPAPTDHGAAPANKGCATEPLLTSWAEQADFILAYPWVSDYDRDFVENIRDVYKEISSGKQLTILSRIYQKYLAKTQPRGAAPASDSPNSPSNPAIEILLLEEPPQVISSPELKIPEPAPDYSIPHPKDSPAMAAFRERWRVRKSSSDE